MSVVVVAAAVMFFAVSASAFALRARSLSSTCHKRHAEPPARVSTTSAAPVKSSAPAVPNHCGQAVYRYQPDGTVAVHFNVCDEPTDTDTDTDTDAALPAGLVP